MAQVPSKVSSLCNVCKCEGNPLHEENDVNKKQKNKKTIRHYAHKAVAYSLKRHYCACECMIKAYEYQMTCREHHASKALTFLNIK